MLQSNVRSLSRFAAFAVALATFTACSDDDPNDDDAAQGSGDTFGCMFDLGLFRYCGEYRGLPESSCEQSQGTLYDECPPGWVGSCEVSGNVNPRISYFYGTAVTEDIVESVCPGGRYVPVSGGAGGTSGAGGSSGTAARGGTGGTSGTGGVIDMNDCNDLENTAPSFTETRADLEDAPEATGGTIAPGTYFLTGYVYYGAPETLLGGMRVGTMSVTAEGLDAGTVEFVDARVTPGQPIVNIGSTFDYATDGSDLVLSPVCADDTDDVMYRYAATPESVLFLYDTMSTDGDEIVIAWRYDKQ